MILINFQEERLRIADPDLDLDLLDAACPGLAVAAGGDLANFFPAPNNFS